MGGIIKAICECGFETDFAAGSSASNYKTVCNAPALCLKCRQFTVKNYFSGVEILFNRLVIYTKDAVPYG